MAVVDRQTMYPFAEETEVVTEGTTPVDLYGFGSGRIVDGVLVRVKTPAVGVCNLIVGDDDDSDGFILAADATAAAGTVYGDAPAERGAYLVQAANNAGFIKWYPTSGKWLKAALSAAPTTQATLQVMIWGRRMGL